MIRTLDDAIELPWLIFVTYWLIAGFRVNKMVRREPAGSTLARILIMVPAYYLLFSHDVSFGFLNLRFVPYRDWVFLLGSALTWLGVAFAIWARYHLAQFWSASVSLREGHQLIRTGPYSHIRHPIYTGHAHGRAGQRSRCRPLPRAPGIRSGPGRLPLEVHPGGETAREPVWTGIRRAPPPYRILPASFFLTPDFSRYVQSLDFAFPSLLAL